ncbi:MAG TPA: chromate transporter [Candidatus Acetothermia bacterium]|nr:chromate transporter [Candidatus Acetothermia bacterium]
MGILFQLYASFFLIGISAYGGGIATIALIQYEIVSMHGWLTATQMRDVITIAQMTPGSIAINSATLTGYKICGIGGALLASLAVITPGVLLLIGYTLTVSHLRSKDALNRVKLALHPGIIALIIYSVYTFGSISIDGFITGGIAAAAFFAILFAGHKVHPVLIIIAAGLLGIAIFH